MPYVLVQYLFKGEEHTLQRVRPHGNAKTNKSAYRRVQPSTREKLKISVRQKGKSTKEILDDVYRDSGDVTKARSASELPRGPKDLYNARHLTKQTKEFDGQNATSSAQSSNPTTSSVTIENVWTLLERAKREEEHSKDSIFIRECAVHPDLFLVLANDRQLEELSQFCTNSEEFSIFGVDPTFNIFDRNISLTVTTFRNLKLVNPNTDKSPVFIGPLLMHQHKDWRTFSKFAHTIITAKPELEGILAIGTDGEKALIDGFKRNFRYAVFLRCFIHFKDNIKRELSSRGFSSEIRKLFMAEIFGTQDGARKYCGLVDRDSEDDFDEMMATLQVEWESREDNRKDGTQTFFEWFKTNKVLNNFT